MSHVVSVFALGAAALGLFLLLLCAAASIATASLLLADQRRRAAETAYLHRILAACLTAFVSGAALELRKNHKATNS
ncbi:MAG: hypothetical protein CMA10_04750 [Euryarchaeota archaeon]|nr:hypothetical protein [Euryarchaeota archaeon]